MTVAEYQTQVHSFKKNGKNPLLYNIVDIAKNAGDLSAVWGSFAVGCPSDTMRWDVIKAHIVKSLAGILGDIAELSTALGLDLETNVLHNSQKLDAVPTNDLSLMVLGLVSYAGKLCSLVTQNIEKTGDSAFFTEAIAASMNAASKDTIGAAIVHEMTALGSCIIDIAKRTNMSFGDIMVMSIYVLGNNASEEKKE